MNYKIQVQCGFIIDYCINELQIFCIFNLNISTLNNGNFLIHYYLLSIYYTPGVLEAIVFLAYS